jgi:hypothetical protein
MAARTEVFDHAVPADEGEDHDRRPGNNWASRIRGRWQL